MIPYARQLISARDVQAVVDVLKSDFLTQGPAVPRFEDSLAEYVGAKNCVAVNSATSGLHIACLSLDVGSGDIVWTSAISFVASANCARMCGAEVGFVDIDPNTFNISVEDLEQRLREADRAGRLPKVLVVVHMTGLPADMQQISELCSKYSVAVIEDASHAIGASYQGERVGSCRYSDLTVFSFHPVKIITTGEGGAVTTNSLEIGRRLRLLRSHGVTRNPNDFLNENNEMWYYEQQVLGYNYRMSDIAAALGCSQLDEINNFISRRNQLARRYTAMFKDLPIALPELPSDRSSSHHLYVAQIDFERLGFSKAEFFSGMRNRGVMLNVHYRPIYQQPYYVGLGVPGSSFPNSESYYEKAVSLPMYVGLSDAEQDHVATSLVEELGFV